MRYIMLLLVTAMTVFSAVSVKEMKKEKRYALLIANGLQAETDTDAAVKAAKRMETFLKQKHFKVTTAFNLNRSDLIKTFRKFDNQIDPNSVVAIVYSGRIIVDDDQSWLLPASLELESLRQLRLGAVSLNLLLGKLERHSPRLSLSLLDGYRYRDVKNGTSAERISAALRIFKSNDLLLHWSKGDRYSGFFDRMIRAAERSKEDIETIAKRLEHTGVLSSIAVAEFYFNIPDRILSDVDKAWARAETKNSIVGYEAFLIAFPESPYKQRAIDRIETLNRERNASDAMRKSVRESSDELQRRQEELEEQIRRLEALKAQRMRLETAEPARQQKASALYYEPEEMVEIPAGVYLMGSDRFANAVPVHTVTIKKPFLMSIYEVSNKAYKAFLDATGTKYRKKKLLENESAAVAYVTWEEARRYAKWLSKLSGKHYRLPTEAEWEYAARGGKDTPFSWGENPALAPQYAWMKRNAHGFVHTRGLLQPNGYGLFDMAGNVAEWCADAIYRYEDAPSESDRPYVDEDAMKVIRGGSFRSDAEELSCAFRDSNIPTYRSETIGFRLVREK